MTSSEIIAKMASQANSPENGNRNKSLYDFGKVLAQINEDKFFITESNLIRIIKKDNSAIEDTDTQKRVRTLIRKQIKKYINACYTAVKNKDLKDLKKQFNALKTFHKGIYINPAFEIDNITTSKEMQTQLADLFNLMQLVAEDKDFKFE